jgi:hypothetical protein
MRGPELLMDLVRVILSTNQDSGCTFGSHLPLKREGAETDDVIRNQDDAMVRK